MVRLPIRSIWTKKPSPGPAVGVLGLGQGKAHRVGQVLGLRFHWLWQPVLSLSLTVLLAWGMAGCGGGLGTPSFREVLLQGDGDSKMLMIDINGEISNNPLMVPNLGALPGMTARIRQELELAYSDSSIRGILLRINSPGGGLTDSDVIYHSIMEFKRAKKVKVVAALGDVAASGGLYIAMSADEIIAHPTSLLGSIGVILSHMEFSGLMEKYGVTAVPVTSGKFKDIESPFRKRTPEETRMLQKIVDHQYQTFLSVVQKGRSKMTPEIIQENADGRLLTSREAVRIGLIDDVGYLDDAYKRLGVISGFPTNRLVRYANSWMTGNNIYSNVFPIESTGF